MDITRCISCRYFMIPASKPRPSIHKGYWRQDYFCYVCGNRETIVFFIKESEDE